MSATVDIDQSTVPGAMQRTIRRELPDGTSVIFEEAPVGFLTKKGEPRKVPWRAYHYTDADGKRRLPSTTGLLDLILSKPGLPPWSEARGIEGLLLAIQAGAIDPEQVTPALAIKAVRALKLGAEAAKNAAADRGLDVHGELEQFMLTGNGPSLKGKPEHHRGFLMAMTDWLIVRNPEPVAVERIVVHPEDGYAGRLDLRARINGALTTVDAKTQEKAAIYPGAHYQVNLYERAEIRCGGEPADRMLVVVFAANGEWREMPADHDQWRIDAALAHWRGAKPIESICESYNRIERDARR
jgi:hypothetical protein